MLKSNITNLHKAHEDNQLQRAELVNQLTQRLDDSQQHCQTLLEQGVCIFIRTEIDCNHPSFK